MSVSRARAATSGMPDASTRGATRTRAGHHRERAVCGRRGPGVHARYRATVESSAAGVWARDTVDDAVARVGPDHSHVGRRGRRLIVRARLCASDADAQCCRRDTREHCCSPSMRPPGSGPRPCHTLHGAARPARVNACAPRWRGCALGSSVGGLQMPQRIPHQSQSRMPYSPRRPLAHNPSILYYEYSCTCTK
jgi:hypothetical protein